MISKLSDIVSLEDKLVELDKECDNYERNLEIYGIKLKAAKGYWGQHEASAELYANAASMGVSAQNIFDAVTIFGNNIFFTPQQIIKDIENYSDIKAAIFRSKRELKKLSPHGNALLT